MSDPFLTRWSRRKTGSPEAESKPAPNEPATAPADDASAPVAARAAPTVPAFDPASLPSIGSITAATDIRVFLAPGVPEELTLAALRRAWAVDPNIRNFVGLADYAWDFNAPDSMAGFGPFETSDELRRQVARMLTARRGTTNSVAGEPSEAAQCPPLAETRKKEQVALAAPAQELRGSSETAPQPEHELAATAQENRASTPALAQRRHGSALPR